MLTQNVVQFAPMKKMHSQSTAPTVRNENLNVIRRAFAAYLSSFPAEKQETALLYAVDIVVAELTGRKRTPGDGPSLDSAS